MKCKVQIERLDGSVLDINASCGDLSQQCLQLLGMHTLSGWVTTPYPFSKEKVTALNTMTPVKLPRFDFY